MTKWLETVHDKTLAALAQYGQCLNPGIYIFFAEYEHGNVHNVHVLEAQANKQYPESFQKPIFLFWEHTPTEDETQKVQGGDFALRPDFQLDLGPVSLGFKLRLLDRMEGVV